MIRANAANIRHANRGIDAKVSVAHDQRNIAAHCRPAFVCADRLHRLALAVGLCREALCRKQLFNRLQIALGIIQEFILDATL